MSEKHSVEDQELFAFAQRVAEIVFEHISSDIVGAGPEESAMLDHRKSNGVNPFYNQTESGFFLEFYYGMPSRLWTPWGKWHFGGSGCGWFDDVTPPILERLGATLHQELKVSSMGEFGPVYAVHRVDDVELPEPKVRERQNYIEYKVAKQAWANMSKTYGHG